MEEQTQNFGNTQYIGLLHGPGDTITLRWGAVHKISLINDCVKIPPHMDCRDPQQANPYEKHGKNMVWYYHCIVENMMVTRATFTNAEKDRDYNCIQQDKEHGGG